MSKAKQKLYISSLLTICILGTLVYLTSSFEEKVSTSKNIVAMDIENMMNENPTASGDFNTSIEPGPTVDEDVLEFLKK